MPTTNLNVDVNVHGEKYPLEYFLERLQTQINSVEDKIIDVKQTVEKLQKALESRVAHDPNRIIGPGPWKTSDYRDLSELYKDKRKDKVKLPPDWTPKKSVSKMRGEKLETKDKHKLRKD